MDTARSRHRCDELADPILMFYGCRQENDRAKVWFVRQSGETLPLPHLVRHSPTGFEWGYRGSGPADLALALCDAATAGRVIDAASYQGVTAALVATIEEDDWELPAARVLETIARLHEVRAHSRQKRLDNLRFQP